ncbi:MAG: hypothetical protein ABI543_08890 [Ignavibacteria bacterium]
MKPRLKFLQFSSSAVLAVIFVIIAGCSDTATDPITTYINNPNVASFDSIGVDEDSAAFYSYTGLNLLNGVNTLDTANSRDCSLNDLNNLGMDFYLQNGQFLNNVLPAGYEIRFFRVSSDMSVSEFDTLSSITTTGHDSLRAVDFTEDGTSSWGYFNTQMTTMPVYCFWLKGRKDAGVTSKNVYGILQPREATDRLPLSVYGYRMSFRVRINTNGDNDFRKQILSVQ